MIILDCYEGNDVVPRSILPASNRVLANRAVGTAAGGINAYMRYLEEETNDKVVMRVFEERTQLIHAKVIFFALECNRDWYRQVFP